MVAEVSSEPIQQFHVRRPLALQSKVFTGLHQTAPKELFPESIDDHARGQWILCAHQPLRQAASIIGRIGRQCTERSRNASRNLARLIGLVIQAALHDKRIHWSSALLHHHGARQCLRKGGSLPLGRSECLGTGLIGGRLRRAP